MWSRFSARLRPFVGAKAVSTAMFVGVCAYKQEEIRTFVKNTPLFQTPNTSLSGKEASSRPLSLAVASVTEEYRKEVIRNYKERIRLHSSPERVFNFYASVKGEDGELYMTPDNFLRSLFPDSDLDDEIGFEKLKKPQAAVGDIKKLIDTDNDGLISFYEYMFMRLLLQTPKNDFEIAFGMFDSDGNGYLEREEFQRALLAQVRSKKSNLPSSGLPTDKAVNVECGIFQHFFGVDGKNKLTYDDFCKYLDSLQQKVLRYEFEQYDRNGDGTITMYDLGQIVLSRGNIRHDPTYISRLDILRTRREHVTFETFMQLHTFMGAMEDIEHALDLVTAVDGTFSRDVMFRAANVAGDVELSDLSLDVIYTLFDANGDGALEHKEFLQVMRARSTYGIPQQVGPKEKCLQTFVQCVFAR